MGKKGHRILAEAFEKQGIETFFYLTGGPLIDFFRDANNLGLNGIDVRHEQAGAFMAQAYSRVSAGPGVCLGVSGPGTTNLVTGVANAWADSAPLVAVGGASTIADLNMGMFQEMDQISMMEPITKWSVRCHEARRLPEYLARALKISISGQPGPVYLDVPGDVLYEEASDSEIIHRDKWTTYHPQRPGAPREAIEDLFDRIKEAQRPILLYGSGTIWSQASDPLVEFVERTGIPFYPTPQARGVIPDDHDLTYPAARGRAFKNADLVIVLGTRFNYVIGHGIVRFDDEATFVQIDLNAERIADRRDVSLGIVGDAATVMAQANDYLEETGSSLPDFSNWRDDLKSYHLEKTNENRERQNSDDVPIDPMRLAWEVREYADRDAMISVDGHQTLAAARFTIPTYEPGHRLNPGPFGTMGVGTPFGIGAKAAKPDVQSIVFQGDGSFGINVMDVDTAIRHDLPVLFVIVNNGSWAGLEDAGGKLPPWRYDEMVSCLGVHGEFVEEPEEIRPALERAGEAVTEGQPAVVNVIVANIPTAPPIDFAYSDSYA